jgi:DNA-binding CsgD family transcriptional regulator
MAATLPLRRKDFNLARKYGLTPREVSLIAFSSGKSGRAISQTLNVGMPTIREYCRWIHGKIGTHSRLAIGLCQATPLRSGTSLNIGDHHQHVSGRGRRSIRTTRLHTSAHSGASTAPVSLRAHARCKSWSSISCCLPDTWSAITRLPTGDGRLHGRGRSLAWIECWWFGCTGWIFLAAPFQLRCGPCGGLSSGGSGG